MNKRPLMAAVQRHSLTQSTWTTRTLRCSSCRREGPQRGTGSLSTESVTQHSSVTGDGGHPQWSQETCWECDIPMSQEYTLYNNRPDGHFLLIQVQRTRLGHIVFAAGCMHFKTCHVTDENYIHALVKGLVILLLLNLHFMRRTDLQILQMIAAVHLIIMPTLLLPIITLASSLYFVISSRQAADCLFLPRSNPTYLLMQAVWVI
jgi:hypothetical protein